MHNCIQACGEHSKGQIDPIELRNFDLCQFSRELNYEISDDCHLVEYSICWVMKVSLVMEV